MELEDFNAWVRAAGPLSPTDPMRGQIIAVQSGARLPAYYPLRQAIKEWLVSDDDDAKAAWLKGP